MEEAIRMEPTVPSWTGRPVGLKHLMSRVVEWCLQEIIQVYYHQLIWTSVVLFGLFFWMLAYKLGKSRNPDIQLGRLLENLKQECNKKSVLKKASLKYAALAHNLNKSVRVFVGVGTVFAIGIGLCLKSASTFHILFGIEVTLLHLVALLFGSLCAALLLYLGKCWALGQLKKIRTSVQASAQHAEHLLEGLIQTFGEDLRAEITSQLHSRLEASHRTLTERASEVSLLCDQIRTEESKVTRIQKFYESKIESVLSFKWTGMHSLATSPSQKPNSLQSLEKSHDLIIKPTEAPLTVEKKDQTKQFDFKDLDNLMSPRSQSEPNETEVTIDRSYIQKLKQWFKLIKQIKEEISSNPDLQEEDEEDDGDLPRV